jgi:hypothetical protein
MLRITCHDPGGGRIFRNLITDWDGAELQVFLFLDLSQPALRSQDRGKWQGSERRAPQIRGAGGGKWTERLLIHFEWLAAA